MTYSAAQPFSASSPLDYLVAPFWANVDISNRVGDVSYEVHSSDISPEYINIVSSFISQQEQVQFNGRWMLLAEWNSVPQLGESVAAVSNSYTYIYINLGEVRDFRYGTTFLRIRTPFKS